MRDVTEPMPPEDPTPDAGGYPPPPATPPQGYPPPAAPPPAGYPPQAPGYPPQQPGYPPQAPGYPPQQPGYPPQQPGYPPQQPGYPPQEDVTWSVLSHLTMPISLAIGLTFIFGPLLIMLIAGPQKPLARANAVEALNFQLTMLIGIIVSIPLLFVIIGFFTLLAIVVAGIVLSILAAVAASRREVYRYPLTIRMVS